MVESNDNMSNGFTNKEILLQIKAAQDVHILQYNIDQLRIFQALGSRPTRTEVISWFGGAGALSGIVFALLRNV